MNRTRIDIALARIEVESEGYGAEDVTESVRKLVEELGLVRGSVTLYSVSRGCFVLGIEYEPNLLADLEDFMKRLGCIESRVPCIALLSKPLTLIVLDKQLRMGAFRRIVFVDVSRQRGRKEVVIVAEGLFERG